MFRSAQNRISRKLIGGAAAAGAALPVLHELVPHSGLHGGTSSAAAGEHASTTARHGSCHGGGAGGPTFRAGDVVNHDANGFDPTEVLRDFDWGKTHRLRERPDRSRVGDRRPRQGDRGRSRRLLPGLDLQRPRARADPARPEGELLRVHFLNGSEHPHTMHFHGIHPAFAMDGMPGVGEARRRPSSPASPTPTSSMPSRSACTSTTATPARWPSTSPAGSTAASSSIPKDGRDDADELVMVMNGFDTNFDLGNEIYAVNSIPFHFANDRSRSNAVSWSGSTSSTSSSSTRSTRSTSTPTSSTTTRPAPARAQRAHRHDHPRPGPARGPRAALPEARQVHVPRPRQRVHRARLDRLLRGQLMEANAQARDTSAFGRHPLLGPRRRSADFDRVGDHRLRFARCPWPRRAHRTSGRGPGRREDGSASRGDRALSP